MKMTKAGMFLLFVEELKTGHKIALGAAGAIGLAALAHQHGYQAGSAGGGAIGRELWHGTKTVGSALRSAGGDVGKAIGSAARDAGSWLKENPAKSIGGLGAAAYYVQQHGGLGRTLGMFRNEISDFGHNLVSSPAKTSGGVRDVLHGVKDYAKEQVKGYNAERTSRALNLLKHTSPPSSAYTAFQKGVDR